MESLLLEYEGGSVHHHAIVGGGESSATAASSQHHHHHHHDDSEASSWQLHVVVMAPAVEEKTTATSSSSTLTLRPLAAAETTKKSTSQDPISSPLSHPPLRKKNLRNKYTRRRAKAARAKQQRQQTEQQQPQHLHEEQQQQHPEQEKGERNDDDDDDQMIASSSSFNIIAQKDDPNNNNNNNNNLTAVASETSFSSSNDDEVPVHPPEKEQVNNDHPIEDRHHHHHLKNGEEEDDNHPPSTGRTDASPLITTTPVPPPHHHHHYHHHHDGGRPDEAATRAQYLAAYHAHPSELDRRAGAKSTTTGGRPRAQPSQHLFEPLTSSSCSSSSSAELLEEWSHLGLHERLMAAVTHVLTFNGASSSSSSRVADPDTMKDALAASSSTTRRTRPTAIQRRAIPAFGVIRSIPSSTSSTTQPDPAPTTTTLSEKPHDVDKEESARPTHATGPRHNLFLHSETGSGKTLAYLLPILQSLALHPQTGLIHKISREKAGVQCLILCPTRELAAQTATLAEQLCRASFPWIVPGCLLGEERRKTEKARLRKGLNILVATPGRFLDHLTRTESLLLALKGKLSWLVLDEVDRLLDMGLGEQVQHIVHRLRSNQPGSGRDGVTWRSVVVSATVTPAAQTLAQQTLLGIDSTWQMVRGGVGHKTTKTRNISHGELQMDLADSTPRQLVHWHLTTNAKLRLATLVAFLAQRVQQKERVVVFLSTCSSVDYHYALFRTMASILPPRVAPHRAGAGTEEGDQKGGIFGSDCSINKLHGSVPHAERQQSIARFSHHTSTGPVKMTAASSAILLATDVAARGLNLHNVDWIVQYDPPAETSDYVHRAGRVARAGRAGESLLFLLPAERGFLQVLEERGVRNLKPMSLSQTLKEAARICSTLTREGMASSGGALSSPNESHSPATIHHNRDGEAFAVAVQHRLENCVTQDDARARAAHKEDMKRQKQQGGKNGHSIRPSDTFHQGGELLMMGREAFLSHLRAYSTKEKDIRPHFSAKALHLGHIARSFALKEPPKRLSASKKKSLSKGNNGPGSYLDPREKRSAAMAFDFSQPGEDKPATERPTSAAKRRKPSGSATHEQRAEKIGTKASHKPAQMRALLLANASKLQNGGLDSF